MSGLYPETNGVPGNNKYYLIFIGSAPDWLINSLPEYRFQNKLFEFFNIVEKFLCLGIQVFY